MSGEIEPTARGSVEPLKKSGANRNADPVPYVPMPMASQYDAPDFVELFPPADTEFQEAWSKIIMVPRAIALAFLWVTYTWWRFAILLTTVGLFILMIINW